MGTVRLHVVSGGTGGTGPALLLLDAITRDPAALYTRFESYRALKTTMAHNVQRQLAPITIPILAIGGAQGLG